VYSDYRMNETNVQGYEQHERMIRTVSDRFITYGYKRIKTSAFEKYDLYASANRSVNRNEMIKVIDHTGEVLVLRPDVTIPLTQQLSQDIAELDNELRYFYVQDVFRRPRGENEEIEKMQAGVEYFSERSPEADAEVIALAIHVLEDLGFTDIKIELGHAGYVKEILRHIDLEKSKEEQLKAMIEAKNVVDIESFLTSLAIDEKWKQAIKEVPFLYGKPATVIKKARSQQLTESIDETIDYIESVYEVLKMYDCEDNIVMDFGLINDMGYYSHTIFQGYVDNVGQPIVMGGRYNELGRRFGSNLPAVGFAYYIDTIIEVIQRNNNQDESLLHAIILYDEQNLKQAIQLARSMREKNYEVISVANNKRDKVGRRSEAVVYLLETGNYLEHDEQTIQFVTNEELLTTIENKG